MVLKLRLSLKRNLSWIETVPGTGLNYSLIDDLTQNVKTDVPRETRGRGIKRHVEELPLSK